MPWQTFSHEADVGVRGTGATPAEAFAMTKDAIETLVDRAGTAWTPTASGIIDVMVGIRPNLTFCWIWDSLAPMGIQQSVAQGPDSGVLVRPYMLFRTRNSTSKTIDLIKCLIMAEENRTT